MGDPVVRENVNRGIDAADEVQAMGGVPFVPHLAFYWHRRHPHSVREWMDFDLEWVRVCDALFRLPGPSKGADEEIACALDIPIPVFYRYDLLDWWIRREWPGICSAQGSQSRMGDLCHSGT